MSLIAYERETVINMNDDDTKMIFTTYQRKWLTALRKNPAAIEKRTWKSDGTEGAEFEIPARLLTIRTGTRKRTMTAEQKQAAADRMRNARASK